MMFAPITRTYTRPLCTADETACRKNPPPLPTYRLNQMVFPSDTKENLAFLYHWQKEFSGDSFDFDYHLMWDIDKEFGLKLAKVLYQDCIRLKDIGLNGLISCQQNRASFPSGLCQYVMGRTLFDPSCDFSDLVEEYAQAKSIRREFQAGVTISGTSLKRFFSRIYERGEEEGKRMRIMSCSLHRQAGICRKSPRKLQRPRINTRPGAGVSWQKVSLFINIWHLL